MKYLSVCSGIEAATVAWHPLGWEPVAFSEIEPFPSAVLAHHYPSVPNVGDMTKHKEWNLEPIDLLVGGTPANPSALQALEKDWMIRVATSCSPILPLLTNAAPLGWFGKTSPASCHLTEEKILEPSSEGWQNSGMGSPTGFLTLNTSEWPSDAAVCSLSDVLETGPVPPRFFLSQKACQGILRRAEKRGKKLPEPLRHALEAVAGVKTQT